MITRLALVLAAAAGACKGQDIPFKPPPPEDAPRPVFDAAPPPVDAAPVVQATSRPTKVAVGDHTSCAVMSDTSLRCWGNNTYGQLGDGSTTSAAQPVTPKLRGVKDVVLGTAHACALLDDSSVACWGRINFDKPDNLLVPTAVPGLTGATRVFAVGTASCASLASGSLVCWGDVDLRGQPGLSGSGTPEHRLPTPVRKLDKVIAITANGALHEDGSMSFWRASAEPQRYAISDVIEIAASGDELCGLRRDGSVGCIGPTRHCAPAKRKGAANVAEPAIEMLKLPPAKRLAFDVGLCVVTRDGRLQCLEHANGCRVDDPWPGLTKVASVSGFCALTTDGGVRCWSVESKSRVVTSIAGISRARTLAASSSHACALIDTGEIVCLGSNKSGALGRGEEQEGIHLDAKRVIL